MKSLLVKYASPIAMGLFFVVLTTIAVITSSYSGCTTTDPPPNSGCGTQMGCCPATGCGRNWLGNVTQLCYATANACTSAGNNRCTQCY